MESYVVLRVTTVNNAVRTRVVLSANPATGWFRFILRFRVFSVSFLVCSGYREVGRQCIYQSNQIKSNKKYICRAYLRKSLIR